MDAEKVRLRAHAQERCALISPDERAVASRLACANLVSLPELADARVVLAYAATESEIDPAEATDHLHALGVTIAYPRVEGGSSLSLRVCARAGLRPGAYGILEPPPECETIAPDRIDAAIVPGVAFDAGCARLGHGLGYYDRLLVELRPDAPIIGVAFDEQVVESVPDETHDVPMDVVVTPSAVYRSA